MAEKPPASPPQLSTTAATMTTTKITDLDEDTFAHCATYLSLQDVSNLAMTSKSLKNFAYSDSIWLDRFRERWPLKLLSSTSGVRKAYLNWRTALHQFKFFDPFGADLLAVGLNSVDNILLDKNDIIFSQGRMIKMCNISSILSGTGGSYVTTLGLPARVTCMRLFPRNETTLVQSEMHAEENILVTSSYDGSIRLWWQDAWKRHFRLRNAAVLTLSDKLLGNGGVKVLASGAKDGTICLWSIRSSDRHGGRPLKGILFGDDKPVKWMSVAGNEPSILVTMSKDSMVRVWDTSKSPAFASYCCVGMTSVRGAPVDMKCHENLVYVAAGSSVVAVDLRIMRIVCTAARCRPKIFSFEILPSKSLICTGGLKKAMLWDVRRNQGTSRPQLVTELNDGHLGFVTQLHMDPYKIVTGCWGDNIVNTWETDTGKKTMSLLCNHPQLGSDSGCCSAMAVNACRIVTACHGETWGLVHFKDFSGAISPMPEHDDFEHVSRS